MLTLADSALLEQGVPGLYTYDGYHKVFARRLAHFLVKAQPADAWIMGRTELQAERRSYGQDVAALMASSPLAEDIRRQYLIDYANYWQRFLESGTARHAGRGEKPGGSTVLDLQIMRILSSADPSPLARLGTHGDTRDVAVGSG